MAPLHDRWECDGLIDASVTVAGYRETAADDPRAPQHALAELWTEFGVTAVRDRGSGWAPWLRQQQACAGRSTIVGGGIVLVEDAPIDECDVRSDAQVLRTVLNLTVASGVGWMNLRPMTDQWLQGHTKAANDAGLRVSVRGPVGALGAASAGAQVLDSFPWLVVGPDDTTLRPIDLLLRWAEADHGDVRDRWVTLKDAGVAVTSELLALHRAVFVKQGLQAAHLDRLEPILPHTRHLADLRRTGGFIAGRRVLAQHSGVEQPRGAQLKAAERGWEVLLESVAQAVADGLTILPGSRAPQMTLCPGYGLLEELAVLAHAGVPADRVIDLATERAASVLGLHSRPSVRLSVSGGVRSPADLLRLRPSNLSEEQNVIH